MRANVWLFLLLTIGCVVVSSFRLEDIADGTEELLDLTLDMDQNTPYWPSIEQKAQNFKMRATQNGYNPRHRYYYHAFFYSTSDQGGTHVDAWNHVNRHFTQEGIEAIPLKQYFGPAVVVNVASKCHENPDYQLQVSDLEDWERRNGQIANGSLVFMYSGWGSKVYNKTDFWGTKDYFIIENLHYPGVSQEAAQWLILNRSIKLIGVETASIDSGQTGLALTAHATFLSNNISIAELVTNLDKMPSKGAFVFGLPLKIKGSSGSPIRLVAVGWKGH